MNNIIHMVKYRGGGVIIWGCMASSGVERVVFIEVTMDRYVQYSGTNLLLYGSVSQLYVYTHI